MSDLILSMDYAKKVYMRRDVVFALSLLFGDSDDKDVPDAVLREGKKGNLDFRVKHPKIEKWIREQYKLQEEAKVK